MSDAYGAQRWISYYNDSGETIPSYALLMMVSDHGEPNTIVNFSKRLRAKKYSISDDKSVYALNSRVPVKSGEYGKCTFAVDGPAWARIKDVDIPDLDLDEDARWIEREYGPTHDKWSIGPNGTGYRILTRPQKLTDTDYHRVLVMKTPTQERLLIYDEDATEVLGPDRSFGGVTQTGSAWLADDYISPEYDAESDPVTVNARDINGIILPGDWFRAEKHGQYWWATTASITTFRGVLEDATGTGPNTSNDFPSAYAKLTGFSTTGSHRIEVFSPFSEPLPANTPIIASFQRYNQHVLQLESVFWITGYDCATVTV